MNLTPEDVLEAWEQAQTLPIHSKYAKHYDLKFNKYGQYYVEVILVPEVINWRDEMEDMIEELRNEK